MDLFKPVYKSHRRGSASNAFDPQTGTISEQLAEKYVLNKTAGKRDLHNAYEVYGLDPPQSYTVWTTEELPGLQIISGLVTPELQIRLVNEAVTEYLSSPDHLTNLDAHHSLARPMQLFASQPISTTISNEKIRNKGLRWVTLGGQYNWTDKVYPTFELGAEGCPAFPSKLAEFVHKAFGVHAHAAIVNYYTEGDILSPHQDVAELSDKDLVSISLGCDCIFYAGTSRLDCMPLQMRLRSGDIVIMGGQSRHAFHGVGRVFNHSSPEYLQRSLDNALFKDWIQKKRVNINIRQMIDRHD